MKSKLKIKITIKHSLKNYIKKLLIFNYLMLIEKYLEPSTTNYANQPITFL